MQLGTESYIKKDYQILGTVTTVDEFGGKIKIKKNMEFSYQEVMIVDLLFLHLIKRLIPLQ